MLWLVAFLSAISLPVFCPFKTEVRVALLVEAKSRNHRGLAEKVVARP